MKWTDKELKRLFKAVEARKDFKAIATLFPERSAASVRTKLEREGLGRKEQPNRRG